MTEELNLDIKSEDYALAQRYASALIDVAQESDSFVEITADINKVNSVFANSPDLKKFLHHPSIPLSEKKSMIDSIFKSEVCADIISFLKLLLDRNRIVVFSTIYASYLEQYAKKMNIIKALVTTAIDIDENTTAQVKDKLEKLYKKNVELYLKKDASIIAGMIVKVENKVIDGSLRYKIDKMKKQLI